MSYGTVDEPLAVPEWNLFLMLHNWLESARVETSFQTTITSAADSVSEERRALMGYPSRLLTFTWRGLSRALLNRILTNVKGLSSGRWVAPLYPDQAPLDQTYASGTTIYCTTTNRRFFVGGRVAVVALGWSDEITGFEFRTIETVAAGNLVLDSELDNSYQIGRTLIFPCVDVEPILEPQVDFHTGRAGSVTLVAMEVVGKNLLPGWDGLPEGFDTFNDYPILDIEHDWIEDLVTTYRREGSLDGLGRGHVYTLRGDRPRVIQSLSLLMERAEALGMIRFFESRLGRCLPFWMPDPEDVWSVQARDANGLNIDPEGEFEDFESNLEFLAIRDIDGNVTVREVSNVVDWTTYWRISLATALPAGLTADRIVSVARAKLSRFESDAFEEEWHTDSVMSASISTIELLEEGEVV